MMKNLFNRYLLAFLMVLSIGSSNSFAQYCAAGSDQCDEFVSDVQIGNFSNPSGCGAGGYTNYTALSIDMMQQTDYPFTILNGPPSYFQDKCGVWVDWNQDGDFDDADETIPVLTNPSAGPFTGVIQPPSSSLLGQTRMRIRIMWTGNLSACGNATYGEVEDYTVNVQPAPSCLLATGLNALNVTSSNALLDWDDISTATGGYLVRYKLVSDPTTVSTWANPISTTLSELPINTLAPTSLYEWQVDADCSGSLSGFTFSAQFFTGCVATDCPVGAITENETCGTDNNGGCNMPTPAYVPLACGETFCGTSWATGGTRDTDWFEFTLTQPSTVTWTVDAEFTSLIGFVNASQGCTNPVFFNLSQSLTECGQAVTTDNLPAGTWWVFVSPNVFTGYACGTGKNRYVATLQCTPLAVAANDECANAIALTQNTTCVTTAANVDNATISLNGCVGTANDDVWFSFVATTANVSVDVTGSASFDAVVEVFDACGGNSLGCTDFTLAGETESAYLPGLTIGNTYYVRVYDFGLGIPATTGFDICVYNALVCPAGAITCDEYIADVALNTLTNPTGCGLSGGYSDYMALSTDLAQGQFYPITVTNGTLDWPDDQCGVWVDWNQDGDFDDLGETVTIINTPSVGPYSGLVDVPATALLGATRMRIRIAYTGDLLPCGIADFGEVEDYTINVIPPPACAYPGGILITNTTDTGADIDWSDVATASSYNVRYKLVTDPTTVPTWTAPINTLVSNVSFSGLLPDSQYEVQIETECGAGSTSGFSPSILFTTLPVPCPNTTCPVGALTENEACGADANGGCNMSTPAYVPLACGETVCGTSWASGGTRDTDWFEFTLTQPSTVTWTVDADFPALIGFVDASQGCGTPQFFNLTQTFTECGQAITVDNLAPGTWWVFVSPDVFNGYPCGSGRNNYVANLSCVTLVVADNDECATAMSLTQNATCINVTDSVANATQSLNGCQGTANDDVWFSFVATSVNPVIDVQGAGVFDAVIETFDACGGNSLGCVDATATGGLESALLTGLTIGNTYFFRVYDWDLGIPADNSFTVCVHDLPLPPVNDDCANAIMLTQTLDCNPTLGSNFLATQSQAGCTGTANDDVWYSFVATTTNPVVELQGIDIYDGVLQVFDACGGTSLACVDVTFGGGLEIAFLNGLVVGNTYYFRVYHWFATSGNLSFNVCVHDLPPPPANDDCANAIPITCTTGTITGSTLQATADPAAGLCVTAVTAPGIWYSFVGNGEDVVASLCAGTNYDSKINIYSGDCNNLVCENGNDDFCAGASQTSVTTVAGVNYYILVQGFGGAVGDFTLDLTFTPVVPIITASGPVAFCQGDSVMLMSDVSGVTWSNGVTADIITVLTGGDFSIAYTDASGCSSLSDTTNVMTYALPAVPVIVAAGPTTFCAGGSVALSVTSNDTILWMPGMETTPSIIANASGSYQVMVTDSNGCSSSSAPTAVVVNTNPVAPIITANASTSICEGGSISITSDVAGDLFWSNGENTQTITVGSSAACYDVVFTDVNSCTAVSNQICVTELPAPVPVISPAGNVNICGGGSLNLDVTTADTYMWSTAETTQTITATTAGSYSCMVTYANGCSVYSDTTVVNFFPAPATPVITPSGATTFCQGGSVTLSSSTANGYSWSSTETTQSIDVLVSGSYVVTTVDANGCSATSQPVTVVVNALPVVNISTNGATQFCQGGSVTITSSIATGNVWSNGETTSAIVVNASGNYSTVVTDANNCSATSSVIAITVDTVSTPSISSSGPLSICNGSTVDLTANPGAAGFAWSNGATTQTITVSAPGVYFVTITGTNGCSATSPSVTITAGSASTPFIIVGGPTIICEGESVTLLSSSISGNTWNTGETTESIEVTTTGNYFVTVSDANGCTATSSLVPVIVNPLPTASFTFNANVGGVVTFTNTSTDYVSSQWNFGDNTAWSNNTNPTHTYLEDGVYTVTLTVFNDCGSITINQVVTVLGTGVEELPEGQSLSIAPNPSNGQFALTFSSTTNQNVNISLLNVNGQVIAEDYLGNVSGSVKRAYDYSQLSKGVYMIRIVTNENVITRRIILE
jgi:PKD repeat protein